MNKKVSDASMLASVVLDQCEFGHTAFRAAFETGTRCSGIGEQAVALCGPTATHAFDAAVDAFLDVSDEVAATVSRDEVDRKLFDLLRAAHRCAKPIGIESVWGVVHALEALPLKDRRVFRKFIGGTFNAARGPLRIGGFTLYDFESQRQKIAPRFPDEFWFADSPKTLVECVVSSRTDEKARQLADVLFNRLDYFLRFIIGERGDRCSIGVFNVVAWQREHYCIVTDGDAQAVMTSKGVLNPLHLDQPGFKLPVVERLFSMIMTQANQFERRIMHSVEWAGQAWLDDVTSSAIVKCATALETLLVLNEKGVVTPSILANIAETSAHILGSSIDDAIRIEREVRRLYGIRSGIVHSGEDSGSEKDLRSFLTLVFRLVCNLLNDARFKNVTSTEGVHQTIRRQRYGHLEPPN